MAKIKVSQVAAAIRKNGLLHIRGAMFEIPNGENLYPDDYQDAPPVPFEPTAACAIGQAAFNLNVRPYELSDALDSNGKALGGLIMALNDNGKCTLDQIADEVEAWIAKAGDPVINVRSSKKLYKKG